MSDAALDTLILPIRNGMADPGPGSRILFLRGRAGAALDDLSEHELTVEQSFAPDRDGLVRRRVKVSAETDETGFDVVLVLPPRQRDEARAQFARAARKVRSGGWIIAAAPNAEGAKTMESDFSALFGNADHLSKHKCRAVWKRIDPARIDDGLLRTWERLDAPRPILDGAFVSRPGVFAWDRIDAASELLVKCLPETLSGRGADLGTGFGYLAAATLDKAPSVVSMDLFEAEKRALDLAEQNLERFKSAKTVRSHWCDVTAGINGPFDFIVSNPPFHQATGAGRTDVGQGFIRAASQGLRSGGSLYLVANRHLPYERTLGDVFDRFEVLADEGGYKVIQAVKGRGR